MQLLHSLALPLLLLARASAAVAASTEVWVDCDSGKDSNAGTAAAPFATLGKARDALRAMRATYDAGAAAPATVNIVGGGTCRSYGSPGSDSQNASLALDGTDSHTTWRVTTAAGAMLSGGMPIEASEVRALSSAEAARFKPSAAAQIRAVSLSRVHDVGRLKGLSYTGGDACIRSDFFEPVGVELIDVSDPKAAQKLVLARYPNLVEPPVPENWADYRDPDNSNLALTVNATADQVKAWAQQVAQPSSTGPQLWTHGLWTYNWADSHRQVLSVNATSQGGAARLALQQHDDFTDRDCQLTAAAPGQQGGHVYVYNSLWDLDQPGEVVIDHSSKTAYLWPHSRDGTAYEATVATSLLTVVGAANITFEGLSFRGARGAAIVVVDSSDVVVSNGAITDCGMSAFNVTGGARCGLQHVEVARAGTGGAVLEGGDRQTLTKSGHFVRDSHLHHSNRWLMNYAPLVLMAGVGQQVERSVLSDAPQTAVFVQGNSHHVINSTIRDVVQQCNDCGSFYFGRDWTYRGMRIQGCNFSLAGPMWDMSWGANAVYADDFGSSVSILDNDFWLGEKMPLVFESNQGRDHEMIGNTLRPLPPFTSKGNSPRANIGNAGCGGADIGYPCTGCMHTSGSLQAAFLNRVPTPLNTSLPL